MKSSRFLTLTALTLLFFLTGVMSVYAHNNAVIHPDITHAAMDLVRTKDEQNSASATGQAGDLSRVKYQEVEDYRGILRSPPPGQQKCRSGRK